MREKNKVSAIFDNEQSKIIGLTLDIPGFDFTRYFYARKRSFLWIPSTDGILNIRLVDETLIDEFGDLYSVIFERLDLDQSAEQILFSLKHIFRQREKLFKSAQSVTRKEAMGLYGELTLLKELLEVSDDFKSTLEGWRRPALSTHDFDFGEIGYEVKTTGLSTNTVKIQSENQLEKLNHDKLFLICYRVECFASTTVNSISLIAEEIISLMNNRILEDQLCEKIGRDFDEFKFDITCHFKIVNEVTESFPKLIATNMNENISGVKYEISMSYIEEHGEKSKMA
ncbi:MAG: PD-(D/E)XK motif protein [Jejuia sp.]